jgi:hypothetical protein
MTLNQIINKIKTQAESHKMVGKFAVGAEFDFAVEEVKYYPLVWLVPNGFTFNTEARLVSYQFAMLVMDRQFESSSNTIEVLSDTAGIIVDIVTLIKRNVTETDFDISVNGQADPFFDSRTDVVAGHGINFTINTPYLESPTATYQRDTIRYVIITRNLCS